VYGCTGHVANVDEFKQRITATAEAVIVGDIDA
jgi:hypothetical protein